MTDLSRYPEFDIGDDGEEFYHEYDRRAMETAYRDHETGLLRESATPDFRAQPNQTSRDISEAIARGDIAAIVAMRERLNEAEKQGMNRRRTNSVSRHNAVELLETWLNRHKDPGPAQTRPKVEPAGDELSIEEVLLDEIEDSPLVDNIDVSRGNSEKPRARRAIDDRHKGLEL